MGRVSTWVLRIAAAASIVGSSVAAPLVDGPACPAKTSNASSDYFSIVGVQGTGIQPRQELRDLAKDTVTWNLFVLALERFQAMDQNDKLSYYRVAGIHGAPFNSPWDGVNGTGEIGYCTHSSNLFATWHRPYLAAFEQILHDRAVEIVNECADSDTKKSWQDSADKLRLPYWDWAVDPPDEDGSIPASLRNPYASVSYPNGTTANISNPLYQYKYHPLVGDDFSALEPYKFDVWNTTIRFPSDWTSPNAVSRNDEVNARIMAQQPNNRDMLYKLLTNYQPFNEWSNKANGGKIGNLETLHDGIHNSFGAGNMGVIEAAAFDPLFWFHHCNVDRIVALYQARYPDTYVEPSVQEMATFAIPMNSVQDTASPLKPFHMNALGDTWTSTTVRNISSFGYTYPELAGDPSNDTLTLSINKLYKAQTQGLNKNNTLTTGTNGTTGTGLSKRNATADAIDWMVEVNLPTAINTTYSVRAFLGSVPQNSSDWPTDSNYVGQVAHFTSPRMDSNVIVTANIVLTERLAAKYKAGELNSLEEADVLTYLEANFKWRIQRSDLTEISRDNAPQGLNVTIVSVPVHLPHSELEVPMWVGDFKLHPEIDGN